MPPSKTVRKGDNTPVPLPDELKRVLKMPKPEFVEYMVKNSTKKELVQLVLMLQSLEPKRQPTLLGDIQVYNNLTKAELSGIIHTRVRKRSCWTSNSIGNMVGGMLWLGIVTPVAALETGHMLREEHWVVVTTVTGAELILNIMISIYGFMQVSKENAYTRKGNNARATLFQRQLYRQMQQRISNKTRVSNKTRNRAWMQDLRNYFQTFKPTKGASTKKAARK